MTLGECLEKTRKLINYYSVSGDPITAADPTFLDDASRAKSAVDTAQKELAKRFPLLRRVTYTQHALRPLDSRAGMHLLKGRMVLSAEGASAFSLLCDGDLTAILERNTDGAWQEMLAVGYMGNGRLECVHGELDTRPAEEIPMRLVLESEGAYVAAVGLYREFPPYEEIPLLDTRRFHPLPADFGGVQSVKPSFRFVTRGSAGFYTLEEGKIGFPWEFDGAVELIYTVYPQTIGEDSAETMTLGVPEEAAEAIPYYVAAILLTDEDVNLSQLFFNLYADKVSVLERGGSLRIHNTLFGGRRG